MRKLPRHLPIHYEDYAPDLAPEQRKAFYGLPKNVQFCRECVEQPEAQQLLRV